MSDVMRARRAELNLSQAQLAAAVGIDARQVRRYEAGDQQPTLSVAVAIANALGLSVGELAGEDRQRLNLSGAWWASWETFHNGRRVITLQEVEYRQRGDHFTIEATTRGLSVEDGGYLWRGELRLWDNQALIGWYAAMDQSVRSKGSLYFALHPQGQRMTGRWVGISYEGDILTGAGAMARSEAQARTLIDTKDNQQS